MCFSLNRSFSKYTSYSEFVTLLEFDLFFEKIRHMLLQMLPQRYKVRCSKTANDNFQVSRVQAPKNWFQWSDAVNYLNKKIGLKSLLTVLSEHKKREKSVKYPCRSLARDILGDPEADSGGKGKTKRAEKNGAKKSKERREERGSHYLPLGLRGWIFLKVSICRHLGNYSVYVQLTQGVWISSENPL